VSAAEAAGATLMVFSERARPVLFYFNSECNFDTPPLPQLLTAARRSLARTQKSTGGCCFRPG
jgi:hypothetical protein